MLTHNLNILIITILIFFPTSESVSRCGGSSPAIGELTLDVLNKLEGVCHTMALPFTLKSILKAKEELWKLKKYFTIAKKIQSSKNLLIKRNQNPSRYYNSDN